MDSDRIGRSSFRVNCDACWSDLLETEDRETSTPVSKTVHVQQRWGLVNNVVNVMWLNFFTVGILTVSICLIIVAFCLYLEARKALESSVNPWAPNVTCTISDAADAQAMNFLHPIIFNGGNAQPGQTYTAEQVFSELGKLQFQPDSTEEIMVTSTFGMCASPGPTFKGCFKTTKQKATLFTRTGPPIFLPSITDPNKRAEIINQFGFGNTFTASKQTTS